MNGYNKIRKKSNRSNMEDVTRMRIISFKSHFYPPVVARVLLFSQKKYGLKKCEKITKNAEFNKDFLGDFIF